MHGQYASWLMAAAARWLGVERLGTSYSQTRHQDVTWHLHNANNLLPSVLEVSIGLGQRAVSLVISRLSASAVPASGHQHRHCGAWAWTWQSLAQASTRSAASRSGARTGSKRAQRARTCPPPPAQPATGVWRSSPPPAGCPCVATRPPCQPAAAAAARGRPRTNPWPPSLSWQPPRPSLPAVAGSRKTAIVSVTVAVLQLRVCCDSAYRLRSGCS